MKNKKDIMSGVAEMRSVATRLQAWADDLEAAYQDEKVSESVEKLTLMEVRAILAEKCAAGYGTQVKALIESFGVSSLGSVPAERYAELVNAANGLGGETDAG